MAPKISLVLPFYNEEAGAGKVIRDLESALEKAGLDYELVLVENGSRDGTASVLKEAISKNPRLKVVQIAINKGYGWGILQGLAAANGDFMGYLCADGQVVPEDVLKVAKESLANPGSVAKVRRVSRKDGWRRRFVSGIYNFLFSVVFGVTEPDINGTPKIFPKEYFKRFGLESKDWFIDAELMIRPPG